MDRLAFGVKMALSSSSSVEEETLGPQIKTEAELTLQYLLDKQLATSGRLEQVDFKEATEDFCDVGHSCAGVSTLAEFRKQRLEQKQELRISKRLLQSDMEIKEKRKRYGANPTFLQSLHLESKSISEFKKECIENSAQIMQQKMGRHAKELEASLLRGKGRLQAIAHLSDDGITCRKPLLGVVEQSELCKGTTPEERARANSGAVLRTVAEVFASPAPAVLDLHTYLEERRQETIKSDTDEQLMAEASTSKIGNAVCIQNNLKISDTMELSQIPEKDICSNRLTVAEIKEWNGGMFSKYSPGIPSNVLYIKNLNPKVEEADLVALFIRYQRPGEHIIFRLMRNGKMKGQCFITFPDKERAGLALNVVNGYKLKERPMVIEFGRNCARVVLNDV
ncbi:hypothetical protein O6H91_01G095000 [Diphasiastrum complanatum]|uniref:Uncharacterized protein n=1 Tax=Diphasiastrum complanatum TaxID=34168 RepID=A0ACC2ETG8_DIPCM|nr:hypothetical protein O6H91_01G095000 [Diphasiastrum complanatum]